MRISIIFSTIYIAGLVFLVILLALPAAALISILPQLNKPPIHFVSLTPKFSEIKARAGELIIPVDVYETGTFSYAQLIMFPGAVAKGRRDPRIIRLADTLARSGLTVYVPELASLSRERFRPEVIQEMKTVIQEAGSRSADKPLKLLSFSIGAGPMLITASDPEINNQIDQVIAFGGYSSLEQLEEFHRTDPSADPFGQIIMTNYFADITEEQKAEAFKLLDPRPHLSNLNAEVLFSHSREDNIIPVQHSRELAAALKELRKPVTLIELDLFTHVNPNLPELTLSNLFRLYVPELWRLYRAVYLTLYS